MPNCPQFGAFLNPNGSFFARRCRLGARAVLRKLVGANRRLLALALRVARPAVTGIVRPLCSQSTWNPVRVNPKGGRLAAARGRAKIEDCGRTMGRASVRESRLSADRGGRASRVFGQGGGVGRECSPSRMPG
jgi:hypothetical protein